MARFDVRGDIKDVTRLATRTGEFLGSFPA
jgi:hypothetical protein